MNTTSEASPSDGLDIGTEDSIADLYDELRGMARGKLAAEARKQTLGATALVHKAWMLIEKSAPKKWRDWEQFFRSGVGGHAADSHRGSP